MYFSLYAEASRKYKLIIIKFSYPFLGTITLVQVHATLTLLGITSKFFTLCSVLQLLACKEMFHALVIFMIYLYQISHP